MISREETSILHKFGSPSHPKSAPIVDSCGGGLAIGNNSQSLLNLELTFILESFSEG